MGYWLSVRSRKLFMDQDAVEVHQHAKEIEANIYPAILIELALSINDFLYGNRTPFSWGSGSQSRGDGFDSSYPLAEPAIESNQEITLVLVLVLLRFEIVWVV